MRALDWAATPVGPVERWPAALKSTVRLLLDCQLPMYLAWGRDYTQFFNDAYLPILGAKDGAALGGDARDTWAEIWPTIGSMWQDVLKGEGVGANRFKLTIDRYGYLEDCYFSFSYSPVPDDDGAPAGVLVTFAETTREVAAERRLGFQLALSDALREATDPVEVTERAAAMLGAFTGAGRAGYGEIDPRQDTVTVHRDWTDGTMASLAGESRPLDSFGPNIIAELRAGRTLKLDDMAADPRSAPYAAGYVSIGTVSLLVVPLLKKGVLVAILYLHCDQVRRWSETDVVVAEDVARRTWDAIERARAEAALRLADRRKDEFLAMLAHELRNPLAPVASVGQLLQRGLPEHARLRDLGNVVTRQVEHMTVLLDDLLDVSRVTRGVVTLAVQPVDLRQVIDAAIEQVRPQIAARRHRLRVDVPPAPVVVRGDFARLVQVVANLLNNSVKYNQDEGAIAVTLTAAADEAVLEVRDDGIGIDPGLLPHVFDLFVQGSRALDRSHGGLGLGLALVRSMVELHHGHVTASSDGEGRGTCIAITLPRDAVVPAQPTQRAGPDGAAGDGCRLRVLLVDDNVDAATILRLVLEHAGHEVTLAHDAAAALQVAAAASPHAVILDIGLPGMDGYALIGHLRALEPVRGACFIALTGYGGEEDRQRTQAAGFRHHFTKPAPLDQLLACLREAGAATHR